MNVIAQAIRAAPTQFLPLAKLKIFTSQCIKPLDDQSEGDNRGPRRIFRSAAV